MKCDELKAYKGDVYIPVYGSIADAEVYLKEKADEAIAELKDKCQMHDFFWEGCGFAKRGFKNTIAVSEAFDRLEAESKQLKADVNNVLMQNQELCRALQAMYSVEEYTKLQNENAELKQKLEDVQASMYCDVVDANMENRKLKRALYKACDNWAVCEMDYWRKCLEHYEDYFNVRTDEDLTEEKCERMIDNWRKVAHNCRAKAEEH